MSLETTEPVSPREGSHGHVCVVSAEYGSCTAVTGESEFDAGPLVSPLVGDLEEQPKPPWTIPSGGIQGSFACRLLPRLRGSQP
jgi:hypothetical protein